MPPETPVGLIGVGLMGEVYAVRLLAAGFGVIGFDIDPARTKRLAQLGGRTGSLSEIARQCDPIVVAVFSTDQVEDVVEHTLVPTGPGKTVICTSTCDPDRIAALGARVAQGVHFLEAPVSGTSVQVRQGDGVGLIGGDVETAQAAAAVLDALFPKRFHIGKIGDGGRAKLAINLILGLNRLALAEGLVFASRLGLDSKAFLQVARASAAASQVMDTKGPKMIAGDFAPEGRVRQTLKDTHLMMGQARKGRSCRFLRFMPPYWKRVSVRAKASATTVSSLRKSDGERRPKPEHLECI